MVSKIDVMKKIIKKVENEVEIITASEWEKDFEEFVTHSLNGEVKVDDLMDYIKTIEFDISWNYESLFREIKIDFADVYGTIDFKYSVNTGITYFSQAEADVLIDYNDIEAVFKAIEKLLPEEYYSLEMQWTFWREEDRKSFVEGRYAICLSITGQ
ncbi:hypothetical protein F6Y05_34465 [Bacillus megaterium]|nr:hypothetical protein [Priestia megaterium]